MAAHPVRAPSLSIVVPAVGDTQALEETLVSVLENRPDDCEIVVALGIDYADPWNIRDEVRFVRAPVGSNLVGCVNIGVAASTAAVVHVLAAGWRATAGWTDAAVGRLADPRVGAVVPLGIDGAGRAVSAGVRRTRGGRIVTIAPRGGDATATPAAAPALEAGFWSAAALRLVGGFPATCGVDAATADVALAIAVAGLDVVTEPLARIIRGPARPADGAFRDGVHRERLFWRSLPAERVLPALVAHAWEIVRHAVVAAPFGTVPMLAGRVAALVQFGSSVPRMRQLRELAARARTQADTGLSGSTLRIDAAHVGPSRPQRRGDEPTPALRRSA